MSPLLSDSQISPHYLHQGKILIENISISKVKLGNCFLHYLDTSSVHSPEGCYTVLFYAVVVGSYSSGSQRTHAFTSRRSSELGRPNDTEAQKGINLYNKEKQGRWISVDGKFQQVSKGREADGQHSQGRRSLECNCWGWCEMKPISRLKVCGARASDVAGGVGGSEREGRRAEGAERVSMWQWCQSPVFHFLPRPLQGTWKANIDRSKIILKVFIQETISVNPGKRKSVINTSLQSIPSGISEPGLTPAQVLQTRYPKQSAVKDQFLFKTIFKPLQTVTFKKYNRNELLEKQNCKGKNVQSTS